MNSPDLSVLAALPPQGDASPHKTTIAQREQRIEENLNVIVDDYLEQDNPSANVVVTQSGGTNLPSIYSDPM